MEYKTLLKADFKRHKGSLAGVFLLVLLAAAALGTVLTVWTSSGNYVNGEMKRAGFGALTAWVSNVSDMESLSGSIENLEDVGRVDTQNLIFSDYSVNGEESDSEGQLIPYSREQTRYKFFTDDFSSYQEGTPDILPGETYVSPSLVSMYDVRIGDEISFPIARAGRDLALTVKGFYEDPFMGSSMIGMKGFLISEEDYIGAGQVIQDSGIDALARNGAMLHIFPEEGSSLTVSELNSRLNESTELSRYTEFIHSAGSIAGFMLVLQNAFSGLLIAFVTVLLVVVMVVLGHSINSAVEADYVNMGILKTVGFTGGMLRRIQMIQSQRFYSYLKYLRVALAEKFYQDRRSGKFHRSQDQEKYGSDFHAEPESFFHSFIELCTVIKSAHGLESLSETEKDGIGKVGNPRYDGHGGDGGVPIGPGGRVQTDHGDA